MNGADALIRALADAGVEVCFANPGTSEMQLVAAIDGEPRMRAILGLFEGVVTGAADGYGRMAEKPALTLLHLGPGFGNGSANLHNANRANSPIINMIGDHATYHREYDAPLTSDIHAFASPVSDWIGDSESPEHLAEIGVQAFEAASIYPGQIASFIAPADHAWSSAPAHSRQVERIAPPTASDDAVKEAAEALRETTNSTLFLGGMALRSDALFQAGRIAAATGTRLITETFFTRLQRGEGRVPVERLPYFGEQAAEYLQDFDAMVIVGTKAPVSFFAYPGKPSYLVADRTRVVGLADDRCNALDALTRLADALEAPAEPAILQPFAQHALEQGPINMVEMGKVLSNHIPENAIVCDEGATNGLGAFLFTGCARQHDWLTLTGGAIGMGLPLALGASVACPNRKVIALQADGSAMYTPQALWTMVRENTDVAVVLLNNSSYAILNIEMQRVGVENPSDKAKSLLDLSNPTIDWVNIANGMGMPASRVETVAEFDSAIAEAMAHRGPRLIEVILPGFAPQA
jgi:acetolactate synthase I/II/III large subunit